MLSGCKNRYIAEESSTISSADPTQSARLQRTTPMRCRLLAKMTSLMRPVPDDAHVLFARCIHRVIVVGLQKASRKREHQVEVVKAGRHPPEGTLTLSLPLGPKIKAKAKPPKNYTNAQDLLSDLRTLCIGEDEVDFSGSYPLAQSDLGVSDKQRVQMVTQDVWKATGYRFTVKDHPPTERGHKTRLWCSQDQARRSSKRNTSDSPESPKTSRMGEALSKRRYACRSRLMIACLPDGMHGARAVTVRLHHYLRHETYVEDPSKAIGKTTVTSSSSSSAQRQQPKQQQQLLSQPLMTSQFLDAIKAPPPPQLANGSPSLAAPTPQAKARESAWDSIRRPPDVNAVGNKYPHAHLSDSSYSPSTSTSTASPSFGPARTPAEFQRHMQQHISRIRDFAAGLEYQVQFGDYRMLETLERDAAPFIALVEDCLKREGRG
ncbi:hypothetical protein C8F01DRAFT_1061939 [Mycena amicta]|nr:hypothetical protein C8F01DRAFT_1061939 [Mycena amicta]